MKKSLAMILLILACVLVLSACGCDHETWLEADCVTPKTCAECGETEGAPLGHSWLAADCDTPKTCEVCAATDGEPRGHTWTDATCEEPKTCSACKLTEGEALGHDWQDATTELPKTCARCAITEGERIITDPRFTTAATAAIQGSWIHEFSMTGEMMGLVGFTGTVACRYYLDLGNDGTIGIHMAIVDEDAFNEAMLDHLVDSLYAELALSGLNKAQADAAMKELYGMNVQQYAETVMNSMDITGMFEAMALSGVYYVKDDVLYQSMSWDLEMEATSFTLEDGKLILHEDVTGMGGGDSIFTRVTEEG